MEEREVELIDYFHVLWRQRLIIAAAFLATVITAWFINTRLPETYSAKTSLLLLPPLASELNASTSGSTLTSQVCQRLATSTEILRAVAADIGLPADTDIQQFSRRVSLSVQAFPMPGEQQFLLDASFQSNEPETAAQMAEAWITAFSAAYEEIFQDRTARSYDYISENVVSTLQDLERAVARRTALLLEHPVNLLALDIAALQSRYQQDVTQLSALQRDFDSNEARIAALEDVLARRTALLLEHPIALLTSDIAALQRRYQEDVTHLAGLRREFDSNKARIAALEDELAKQTSVVVLERSLDPDTLAIALQSGLSNRAFDELLGLRAQAESENATFVSLTSNGAYARARSKELSNEIETLTIDVADEQAKIDAKLKEATETQAMLDALDNEVRLLQGTYARAELANQIKNVAAAVADERAELDAKQKEATETQAALDALDNEVKLLREGHARLALKLQDARAALAETWGPVRVIDGPDVPTAPASQGMKTSVAIAGFLGLVLGVTLAFLFDYLQRMREVPQKTRASGALRRRDGDGPPTPAGRGS
jgi:uncharacterized protein involved in exopolysaccharide biosynthesis